MRALKVACIVAVFLIATGCAQLTADEIVKKMKEKYDSVRDIKGEIVTTIIANGKEESRSAKYWMKNAGNVSKIRVEDERTVTVSNGSVLIVYDKENKRITVMNVSTPSTIDYGELIKQLLENYDVRFLGEEEIGGIDCYVINATPKIDEKQGFRESRIFIKMWIDKEYWYPIRVETGTGNLRTIVEYRNVSFNTGINDEIFEFEPPSDAEIVKMDFNFSFEVCRNPAEAQEKVNFTILTPGYTAGYELKNITVMGDEAVTFLYTKENKTLYIHEAIPLFPLERMPESEEVSVKGVRGFYVEYLGARSIIFDYRGVRITVSSNDMGKKELMEVAESLEPLQ